MARCQHMMLRACQELQQQLNVLLSQAAGASSMLAEAGEHLGGVRALLLELQDKGGTDLTQPVTHGQQGYEDEPGSRLTQVSACLSHWPGLAAVTNEVV